MTAAQLTVATSAARTLVRKARLPTNLVEDIAQEGALAAWQCGDTLDTHIAQTTRLRGIDWLRATRIAPRLRTSDAVKHDTLSKLARGDGSGIMEFFTHLTPAPDKMAAAKRHREQLVATIRLLPPVERYVVVKSYFADWTLKQIGAALELTEGRICQIRTAAITHLKETLCEAH